METPLPTKALLASFHSGRWVFIHIPPSGIKFDIFAKTVAKIFSIKLTLYINTVWSRSKAPSTPISSRLN